MNGNDTSGLPDQESSEKSHTNDRCDPIAAAPYVSIEGPVSGVEVGPQEGEGYDGEINMSTHPSSGVVAFSVSVASWTDDVDVSVSGYVGADEAEEIGALFLEFAEKLRAGEEWVHP